VVADKVHMSQILGGNFDEIGEDYKAATLVGEFILIVRNNTGKVVNLYPDQATVLIKGPNGTRQTDVSWSSMRLVGMDDISGEIHPDVIAVGGYWYPLPAGTEMVDVQSISLIFDGPSDSEYNRLGDDYVFEFDLSHRPDNELDDSHLVP